MEIRPVGDKQSGTLSAGGFNRGGKAQGIF
jgi:hypothetical protein